MGKVLALALFATACGRVSFDAVGDGGSNGDGKNVDAFDDGLLAGHDEDGDGIPDTADNCPHIADSTLLDDDGDLVGNVCDRNPSMANESWFKFVPMTFDDTDFARDSNWSFGTDTWNFIDSTNPSQLLLTEAMGDVDIWIGFDLDTIGTGGSQAAIVVRNSGSPYWYGEYFYTGAGSATLNVMHFDGANYNALNTLSTFLPMQTGSSSLHLATHVLSPQAFDLNATFPSGSGGLGANTGYTGASFLLIAFGNVAGKLRYIAIIKST